MLNNSDFYWLSGNESTQHSKKSFSVSIYRPKDEEFGLAISLGTCIINGIAETSPADRLIAWS